MKTFSSMAGGDQAGPSNRRQPVRQTRTNPARTTTNTQTTTGSTLQPPDDGSMADPGFFPAITHFTNSITALPKEMIRHYTMLKEVDAKIYGPEEVLGQLLSSALKSRHRDHANGVQRQDISQPRRPPAAELEHNDRRALFAHMRTVMGATLAILDEKNHVMNTANDTLDRQLRRCESSYPHVEEEISDEARNGSLTHWAYSNDKPGEKKSILVGERTRRQANYVEADAAANRSEQRREAMKTSKGRNQHLDSDFDDNRAAGRRGQAGAKGRKIADSGYAANGGSALTAAAPPSKRRKTEKAAAGGVPMERAMSAVYGSNSAAATRGSARDALPSDSKKKSRAAGTTNGVSRQRGNTNVSGVNSPVASSPIMGTFAPAGKGRQGRSPAPPMQRMPSSRARQNSNQNAVTLGRNRSTSTNHQIANGGSGGMYGTTADVDKISGVTGRTINDIKSTMKEAVNGKGEHLIEDLAGSDGAGDMRGGLVVGSRNGGSKREDQMETPSGKGRADRPGSISTRGGGGSKAPSANPTPRESTFGESSQKPRQPRGAVELPQKRSHKKGAGLAAQLAAQAAQNDDDGSSVMNDEDEEEGENEPRYCYCNGVSYGEMVGCDADDCPREWFHLQCVGLTKAPAKNAKWYCDECKENLKRGKFMSGNGR